MQKQVWLGGNIGVSLLHNLEQITADDVVVLELSSFQLHQLRNARFAPQIAVVTNFTANHLEWHGTLDSYRTAKNVILRQQHKDHVAILHSDLCHDPNWRVRGRLMSFAAADSGEDGVFAEEGLLIFRSGSSEDALRFTQPPQLPGKHNLANIAAAACAVWQLGLSPHRFLRHLQHFQPLPHRLQQVAHGRGVRFFNDSIATTPESAIAALNVCQSDCVILAGGYDKGIDLSEFARHIATHASAVVLMGQTSDSLAEKIAEFRSSQHTPDIRIASDFSNAFSQAVELVRPGGIVLLSPGCASYGWFRDFRDRGDQFTQLARQWVTDS
jgi:UDP-N-acetylmuramoylalanine--D-glutamate ligase